jgi:hypothetical protein
MAAGLAAVAAECDRGSAPRRAPGAAWDEDALVAAFALPARSVMGAISRVPLADVRAALRSRGLSVRLPRLSRCSQREAFLRRLTLDRVRRALWEPSWNPLPPLALPPRALDALLLLASEELRRWG